MPSSLRLLTAGLGALLCLLVSPMDARAQNTVPDAPTLNSLIAGETWLGVTWNPPDSDGGASITSYILRHIESDATDKSDSEWTEVANVWLTNSGDLAHVLTGLDNGTGYDVQVRGVNSEGEGAWSATQSATPGDYGDTLTSATELILDTWEDGAIHPIGSNRFPGEITTSTDIDYFKIVLTDAQVSNDVGLWLFTDSEDLDTVGELQDEDGNTIERDDYGAVLPNVEDFFMWTTLEAGTYYLKVNGYGSGDTGDYDLVIRTFRDTRCPSFSVVLRLGNFARGMLDPDSDADCFSITLSERTDVIFRSAGFPDAVGELYSSGLSRIASNDDGLLVPSIRQFLIRRTLAPGTYFLNVRSFGGRTGGAIVVYATEAGDPGDTAADAHPLSLSVAAGGNITSATDVDYFKLDLAEDTYVRIWTARNTGNVDTDGELLDENSDAVTGIDYQADLSGRVGFGIEHHLSAGTYYIKVTGDGSSTGQYTIRVTEDVLYQRFVDACDESTTSVGIDDEFYRCQWHLDNDGQFPDGEGEDINVESVWADYTGDGVTVAVVDDGMHHQHEDLRDNVDTSKNRDYTEGGDIYTPGRTHGTAVAGLIAAQDNSIGMRGVAPDATIYGYNYLVRQSNANEADAMIRNKDTTAVSNNSWGPGDFAGPERATEMWERAVRDGITTGYGGKGIFYAWSAGNGGLDGDNSNLDEYNNFYAVTSVCAVNHKDKRSSYSEEGANLWICAPSSDRRSKSPGIATTDNGNRYMDDFGGTSAAAPIVSGVAALLRQANPSLTWRDLRLILAASARKNDPGNSGWEMGAEKYGASGSYEFNHEYGFGMVDAQAAVNLADGWTNLPPQRETSARSDASLNLAIADATKDDMTGDETPGATTTTQLTLDQHVGFIEFIHVEPHFDHSSFRDLDVELESPGGKVSKLVPYFQRTFSNPSVPLAPLRSSFRFGSAKHLGEDAAGTWTLRVTDHHPEDVGILRSWKLTAFGHGLTPLAPNVDELFAASGGYTVLWKAPNDTGQGPISAYDVRHIKTSEDETDDANWTVVDNAWTSGDLQYVASGLEVGTRYDVQARAVNSHGDSAWSDTVTVVPTTDEAPTVLTVTPGDALLIITWNEPTNTGLGTITSYDLRYKRSRASSWSDPIEIWTSGALRYILNPTDSPLVNGTSYDVQIRAVVDTDDAKPWSQTRSGTPRGVPGAPTIGSLDSADGKLEAHWNAPSDNGGADITSYDLRYIKTSEDETDDANWTVESGVWESTSLGRKYTIDNLDNWHKYDVQVRAENDAGPGDWSDTATGTPTHGNVNVRLRWEQMAVAVDENASSGSVTLRAIATTTGDQPPPSDFFFGVTVDTADGSGSAAATQPDDYVSLSATHTFNAADFVQADVNGQQRYRAGRDFTVVINDDDDDETDETFTATLSYANPDISHLQGGNSVATVTIADDEHVPVALGWLQDEVSVNEGAGSATLNATATTTVDKRPETGFAFDASVSTSSGTADVVSDYTHLSTTVTFQRNDFSRVTVNGDRRYRAAKRVQVPVINDTEDERDEDFDVTVSYATNPRPPHLTGGPASATVTITDNDLPEVTVAPVSDAVAESATMFFTLTRGGILDDALTVNVRVSETGNILASGQPASATFDANSSTARLEVSLDDDTADENDSKITARVVSGSDYTLGSPAAAEATATDNDHVPVTLSWDRTSITVAERVGEVTLRAMATTTKDKQPETGFAFTVQVSFTDVTATGGDDYADQTLTGTFSQSDFTRTNVGGRRLYRAARDFTINVFGGDGDEPDETFTANLAYADPGQPYLQGSSSNATVTIADNDDPLVSISADTSSTSEDTANITFTLTRDGQTTSSLRANVRVTESGNMLAGGTPSSATFGAGDTETTIRVNLSNDNEDEENSVVTVEVLEGNGYFPGTDNSARTTVTDDDHVPVTIGWAATELTVGEGAGVARLTAVATTTKDKMPESGFTFDVIATTSDGSARQPGDYEALDETSGRATFNQSNFSPITVGSQGYYQATMPVDVSIENDALDEDDENFRVALAYSDSSPPHLQGGGDIATVTIADDDHVPVVIEWQQAEWSLRERDGSVTLKAVALTTQNRRPEEGFSVEFTAISIDDTAQQPGDYKSLSKTDTFVRTDFNRISVDGRQRYQAAEEFRVDVENDGGGEDNEKFSLRLSITSSSRADISLGDSTATVWIIEDETQTVDLQLTRNSPPSNPSPGDMLTYEYTVKNQGSNDATGVNFFSKLDPNVDFLTVDPTSNCIGRHFSDGDEVSCDWPNFPSRESETVEVEATIDAVPETGITNKARLSSPAPDTSPEDNVYPPVGGSKPPPPPPPPSGGGGGGPPPPPASLDPDPAETEIRGAWLTFAVASDTLERVTVRINLAGSVGALDIAVSDPFPPVSAACAGIDATTTLTVTAAARETIGLVGCRLGETDIALLDPDDGTVLNEYTTTVSGVAGPQPHPSYPLPAVCAPRPGDHPRYVLYCR